MAILTEPTIIRDDDLDDAVIVAAFYGDILSSSQFVCRRYDDDADFWVAKHNWFGVGDGTNVGNKYFVARTGDANEPFIRYNVTAGAWELSDNGVDYNRLGPTASPTFASLLIVREDSGAYFYARVYASSSWGVVFFDRARGTRSSPTAVQNGDTLGGMQFRGWDGSGWGLGAFIYCYAAENFSTSGHGAYIRFYTVPTGSTSYYERMRIENDGVVYIYSTANPCLSLSGGLKIGTLTGALFASSGTVSALAATAGSQYLRRNAGNTAYEWATISYSDVGAAPVSSAFVTIGNDAILTHERALAVGNSLTMTDGGANSTVTLNTIQDIRTSATPTFASLTLKSNAQTNAMLFAYSNTEGDFLYFRRARGTEASPSAIQSGDELGAIVGQGYHSGGGFSNTVTSMRFAAAEAFTSTGHGAYIYFETTPTGSTTRVERMRIDHDGSVYVWTGIYVLREGSTGYLFVRTYADSSFSVLYFDRARGTRSSPTAVQNGDILGGMQFRGWDGSSFGLGAFIYAYAAENFSTSGHGAHIRFYIVPTGSTSYSERMRIENDGVVYIYSTANPCLSLSGGLKIGTLTGALFASSGTVSALAATAGSQYLRRNAGNTAYEWAALAASDLPNHATRHESGGADAITGNLDANARVGVRVNTGATTYKRRRINFIAGTNVTISHADDATDEEVDVTISSSGGAPTDAQYVVLALHGSLSAERQLAVGASLTMTDGGANSTVTLNTIQDIRTTATPTFTNLNAIGTDQSTYLLARACSNSNYGARMIMDRSRGTSASPTAVQSGDAIGYVIFRGYDGSTWSNTALMQSIATQNWSTTARGAYLSFWTTADNSTTNIERVRITASGSVEVYYSLACYGDGTTSNIGIYRYSSDATGPSLLLIKARGSRSTPSTVAASDTLGSVAFYGWGGSAWYNTAAILAIATQAFGASAGGTELAFYTTADGNTSYVRRMRITNAGTVAIDSSIHTTVVLTVGGESEFYAPCRFKTSSSKGGIYFESGVSTHPSTRSLSLWYYGNHFYYGKAESPTRALGTMSVKTNTTSTTTTTSYFIDTSIIANSAAYPGGVIVRARGRITASASVTPTITFSMVLASTTITFTGSTAALASGQWVWWELTWYLLKDDGTNTWKAHARWIVSGIIGGTTGFAQIDATNSRMAYHTYSSISPGSNQTFRVGMATSSTSATIYNDYAVVDIL